MARFLEKRETVQGKAPGSMVFIGNQKMEHPYAKVIQYTKDSYEEVSTSNWEQLKTLRKRGAFTWINLYGLHESEPIQILGEQFDHSLSSLTAFVTHTNVQKWKILMIIYCWYFEC